jgi:hypothetical protein
MALLGKIIAAPLKALGIISTPGQAPTALPTATRDDAAAAVSATDELRRRKGGAADLVNGAAGVQAPLTGGKLTLGS